MPKKTPLLPTYLNHKKEWDSCTECMIGKHTTSRIYYRGTIPADLLIVGESPNDTDLVLNKPFSGPAGKCLDRLLKDAYGDRDEDLSVCMTYSILCAPCLPPQFKLRAPSETEIRNCSNRLQQFYDMVKPKHVVCVGRIAEKAIKKLRGHKQTGPPKYTLIPSPTSIINQEEQGTLDYKRALCALKEINI